MRRQGFEPRGVVPSTGIMFRPRTPVWLPAFGQRADWYSARPTRRNGALGANTRNAVYGATGNPFDPEKSCAGSSGGSAVALATGMAPLCTGSDMGGSLRNPAAFCGIVGFRPSPGLVPSEKRALGWSPLSVLGPMARNVEDLCLLLSAMASDDARDPLAYTLHGAGVRSAPGLFWPPRHVDLATAACSGK